LEQVRARIQELRNEIEDLTKDRQARKADSSIRGTVGRTQHDARIVRINEQGRAGQTARRKEVKSYHFPRPHLRPPNSHFRGRAHGVKIKKKLQELPVLGLHITRHRPMGFDDVRDERQKIIEQWSF
jgi:hypothetical protein